MIDALKQSLRQHGEIRLTVRVHPAARKTTWKGVMADGTLKADIAAPPEDGKANAELIGFLAAEFGVPRGNVEIVSGQTGRRKTVIIDNG